jgi:peptide/nickel transport system substrate-binding protein
VRVGTTARHATAAVGLALALVLSACGAGGGAASSTGDVVQNNLGGEALDNGSPSKGGSLKFGSSAPIETLDPIGFLPAGAGTAALGLYGSLMQFADNEGAVEPMMAESLETKDSEHWTLKLRPGITFTDGTPFNAQAVVAHWERFTGETSQAYQAARARAQLKSYEATDDLTVTITTQGPQYELPSLLTYGLGMVPSPVAVEKAGERFGLQPVGAGPFKVDSFKPGGEVTLVRNEDYFDSERPYLDQIDFVTVPTTQASAAIQSGDLDISVVLSASDVERATLDGLTTLKQGAFGYWYMMLNHAKPPFDDPDIRKAVIQAIDFAALSSAVFNGSSSQLKAWIPTGNTSHVESGLFPSKDVTAAKEAVAEYKAAGGNTEFALQVLASEDYQKASAILQQMLDDIGLDMSIKTVDLPTQAMTGTSGDYQAQLRFATIPVAAGSDMWNRFHSESGGNQTHSGDPTVDKILDEIVATPPDERAELWSEFADEMVAWVPFVPLVEQSAVWILSDRVGGFPGAGGEITWEQMTHLEEIWAVR